MSQLVRRAGRGTDATGALVVWSVADGRRGRRWREVRSVAGGSVISSLLLETDPDGRFSHAELSTGDGLLTLHPESDGTLHGNVVTADGVMHVAALRWSPNGVLIVEGSTIAAAAAAHTLRDTIAVGASMSRPAVFVDLGLAVFPGDVTIERTGEDTWRLGSEGEVAVDDDGLPLLTGAKIWPLEAE
ncbi:MAG: hypothetical protein M3R57_02430 [Chloroflexota bacterium]|nr:hypothetical protein [Chloroflexota bacterium]